jgi:uncharacterized protein YutE (UPF0331/DUF86 family)
MVDADLVERKLADVDRYLGQLAEFRQLSIEEYRADWKVQRIVERTLYLAIDSSLGVAGHAVADRGPSTPATSEETFVALEEAGLLSEELRAAMVRITSYRNLLVHGSTCVDPSIVIRILQHDLRGLGRFLQSARAWV